jgi:hypothetical protein
MIEVRRTDGELCGFVTERDGRWAALTVFGVSLCEFDAAADAHRDVLARGLAVLADRWTLTDGASGDSQVACIQQASPAEITLALDYFSLPGVPTITVTADDLTSGRWILTPGV